MYSGNNSEIKQINHQGRKVHQSNRDVQADTGQNRNSGYSSGKAEEMNEMPRRDTCLMDKHSAKCKNKTLREIQRTTYLLI